MKKKVRRKFSKALSIGVLFTFVFAMTFAAVPAGRTYAASYDGTNPYSTGCASKSPITYATNYIYKSGVKIGYVQLKGSAYCHTAWGYVKFYSSAPYNYYANVWVDSYNGSTYRTTVSCASSGGNDVVMKGQTSCYTAQLYDKDPYNAQAEADVYSSSGALIAYTYTGRY
ncbi:DUF2690 domain-containing protein [Paenibacillus humicola]|uniref:DUF2690 domain-containing protein n=1 Tax=Paenibacillus humicola TaxID=3110540 RepID=UPI00237AAA4F|nr:DUF2690 domain-containing protein [Paenibacillus humicola]